MTETILSRSEPSLLRNTPRVRTAPATNANAEPPGSLHCTLAPAEELLAGQAAWFSIVADTLSQRLGTAPHEPAALLVNRWKGPTLSEKSNEINELQVATLADECKGELIREYMRQDGSAGCLVAAPREFPIHVLPSAALEFHLDLDLAEPTDGASETSSPVRREPSVPKMGRSNPDLGMEPAPQAPTSATQHLAESTAPAHEVFVHLGALMSDAQGGCEFRDSEHGAYVDTGAASLEPQAWFERVHRRP